MSTNATFILPDDDGTFSVRYHHWDGYPKGLGMLLHETVDTAKKVQWLFGLNTGFSTLMRSKPTQTDNQYMWDEYNQPTSIQWPSGFKGSKIEGRYIVTMSSEDGWDNTQSWASLHTWMQEYNYVWHNKTWNVIAHYGNTLSKSTLVEVSSYIQAMEMLSTLEAGENIENWSWKELTRLLDVTENKAQKIIAAWQREPLSTRQILCNEYCGNVGMEPTDFVQQLDAWMMNQKLSQTIQQTTAAARKKKM